MRLRSRHRRSRMKWVCAATAPWALSLGLLISFTAEAGNTPQSGLTFIARGHMDQLAGNTALAGRGDVVLRANTGLYHLNANDAAVQAVLHFDSPPAARNDGDGELKAEMKKTGAGFPEVNRSAKGSPAGYVQESLSRRAIDLKNSSTPSRLAFARDERTLPPTIVMPGSLEAAEYALQTFMPFEDDATGNTTQMTSSVQSPSAATAGSTGSGRTISTSDGGSPIVARAYSLSSATPAPLEEVPLEVAAAPVSRYGLPAYSEDVTQPNYSALVSAKNWNQEKKCLAEAVYFEARSETPAGQAAVAQVVLNRVRSGLYPTSICGVVYQNRHRHLACQFTFACEGKALRVTEPYAWAQAQRVADEVLEGKTYLAEVGGSTHYHANYVKPYWAKRLKRMDVIGRHIFYKLKPGQT